jgi:hypothetical protein
VRQRVRPLQIPHQRGPRKGALPHTSIGDLVRDISRRFILQLAAVLAPSAAIAQGIVHARVVQTAWNVNGFVANCLPPGSGMVEGTVSYTSCDGSTWGGSFEASASAVQGVLGGLARVEAFNYDTGEGGWLSTRAVSTWTEQVLVGGSGLAYLELTMRLTGVISKSGLLPGTYSGARASAVFNGQTLFDSEALGQGSCRDPNVSCPFRRAVNETFTRVVPIGRGTYTSFYVGVTSDAFMGSFKGEPVDGHAMAGFGNTLRFTDYRVLNAGGTDITNAVQVTFAQGTTFTPSTTVPEPTTWALLGTGLAALGGAARRRTRAA